MENNYLTVLTPYETEIDIKKSRFIGRVYPITDEKEADAIISRVKKEHYKATHVCSAWVLHTNPLRQKASDDGEPSGTAGKPILEVINLRKLKNILVVVIRYFGGIKLGAGGLIRAYSGTGSEVLNDCQVVKKQFSDILTIEIDYPSYGGLINVLNEAQYVPVAESFGEKVTLDFEIAVEKTADFLGLIRETTNDRFDHVIVEQRFVDILI
ncbi:MAG: YigZ family protein [Eubacterium sp.]